MIDRIEAPVISCPTCEYRRGHTGQPVSQANGTMICNICDSKWRNLNRIQDIGEEFKTHPQQFENPVALIQTSNIDNLGQLKPGHNNRHRSCYSAISIAISCALVVLAVANGDQILNSNDYSHQAKVQNTPLTLDNIKIEGRSNNQAPFWIVTARITNNTLHSVAVPPILMRSGNKGSSGYFDWTYRPALQKLAPGTNLIIRSSIHKPAGSSKNIEIEFADNNLKSG